MLILLLANDISENPGPYSSDFTIFHLNTRSIRYKIENLVDYVDSSDILCFTETHLDNTVLTEDLMIDNYETPFRRDRTNHGGGVMIYYKTGLAVKRRHDLESDLDEMIWSEIKLPTKKLLLCTLYRPPGHPNINF